MSTQMSACENPFDDVTAGNGSEHFKAPSNMQVSRTRQPAENNLYPSSVNPPKTVIATPHLGHGSQLRSPSANSLLGASNRLHRLTPIHGNMGATLASPNTSTPQPRSPAIFTTSPASSEPGSPGLRGFEPEDRSASHSSLQQLKSPATTPKIAAWRSRSRGQNRSSSHPGTPLTSSRNSAPHPQARPSVKHLTCFWWKERGDCRFKEEDCLYAHHDTGLYADPPRQVVPGGEFF